MSSDVRVYIDLETTGTDPGRHAIVEVAAVAFRGGQELDSYTSLVNPGEAALAAADPRALDVNQIELAQIRSAPPTDRIANELHGFLHRHNAVLYAFPVSFESSFLAKAPWSLNNWGECIMQAVQEAMASEGALPLINGKPKRPRLGEAAAFFGVTGCGPAHRSLSDARKLARVHHELMMRIAMEDEVTDMLG